MNEIQKFEQGHIKKLIADKNIPEFQAGDTVRVNVKISEKSAKGEEKFRIQAYEGLCIARGGRGINLTFTVRKISYNEGVERVFPLFSPMIDSIELVRRGSVRRAKLYYLRGRRGKSARIAEREDNKGGKKTESIKKESAKKVETPKTEAKKAATA